MIFDICGITGNLKADGEKGQYWIILESWIKLQLLTFDDQGPHIKELGRFKSAHTAEREAIEYDDREEEHIPVFLKSQAG